MDTNKLMNGKFTFKKLPDGSIDKTKVICVFCGCELSYHRSTSSLKYHLMAKHTADASTPPPRLRQRSSRLGLHFIVNHYCSVSNLLLLFCFWREIRGWVDEPLVNKEQVA